MNFFGQRVLPQSIVTMGDSGVTIARAGCTTCALSSGVSFFGIFFTPSQLAKILSYTSGGYIKWESLKKIGVIMTNRFQGYQKSVIDEALKNPNEVCLIQVQNDHWVLALGKNIFGGYKIFDPWYNDFSTTKRYKDQVTGGAVITKK